MPDPRPSSRPPGPPGRSRQGGTGRALRHGFWHKDRLGDRRGGRRWGLRGGLRGRLRRGWWTLGIGLPFTLMLVALGGLWALAERPSGLPRVVVDRLETALARRLGGGRIDIGAVHLRLTGSGDARIETTDMALSAPDGTTLGRIARGEATLSGRALLSGRIEPQDFAISGAEVTLRRGTDGALSLDLGGGLTTAAGQAAGQAVGRAAGEAAAPDDAADGTTRPPEDLLATLRRAFAAPPLRDLDRLDLTDLTVRLDDAVTGRRITASGGRLRLRNADATIAMTLFAEIAERDGSLSPVQASLTFGAQGGPVAFGSSFGGIPARDIAALAPALAFLDLLDAPVSGAIRGGLGSQGAPLPLAATLEIGAGTLQAGRAAEPARFDAARLYASYDPRAARLDISELSALGAGFRVSGGGRAWARDISGGRPQSFIAQIRIDEAARPASPASPAGPDSPGGPGAPGFAFDGGRVDARVRLDPLTIEIGQALLLRGDAPIRARGRIARQAEGWAARIDAETGATDPAEVLRLWPERITPKLRAWLAGNLRAGRMERVVAAVRKEAGAAPKVALSFDYSGGELTWLRGMPPIRAAAGFVAVADDLAVRVDAGRIAGVDVAGSSFRLADLRQRPPDARLDLVATGPLSEVLAVLDHPPLRLMERAGRTPDLARGTVRGTARITFPLRRLTPDDLDYDVRGVLTDVESEAVVPGRRVTAERLDLAVTPAALGLSGAVALDGLPAEVEVTLPLGPVSERGPGRITGTAALTPEGLATLGVRLPDGAVRGRGTAAFDVTLPRGGPPVLTATTDLAGLALSVPALGWSHAAAATGWAEATVRLSRPPAVERIALEAPGLALEGRLELSPSGAFAAADLGRVRAGGWLDAPVRIEARGPGQTPRIRVAGGTLDIARRPDGGGGGGAAVPIEARLDRLRLTDTIAIAPFVGSFTAAGGLTGGFEGRVNGGAVVTGDLVAGADGTGARIRGADAGAILRDAGLFRSLDAGRLDLTLLPRPGAGFDGRLRIGDTRLRDQPILVDMLDAVSIVGLIDQIRGPGIVFDTVEADFRLLPDRVVVDSGSAVGASLGVSLDGVYDIARKRLDMGGVVSPVYLLNSIGSIFTRRGEGLFGFTFRLAGDPGAPRVSVNPLSILTPGLFREIFRRPPPRAGE